MYPLYITHAGHVPGLLFWGVPRSLGRGGELLQYHFDSKHFTITFCVVLFHHQCSYSPLERSYIHFLGATTDAG